MIKWLSINKTIFCIENRYILQQMNVKGYCIGLLPFLSTNLKDLGTWIHKLNAAEVLCNNFQAFKHYFS